MRNRGLIAGLLLVLVYAAYSFAGTEKVVWQWATENDQSLPGIENDCIDNEVIIYQYGFELPAGQDDWEIDNGIWELCIHGTTAPPGGGSLYFATICDGTYPTTTDSHLISPEINLPPPESLVGDEKLHLRFWHWFSYEWGDYGQVQISVYDAATGWSPWKPIGTDFGYDISGVWSPAAIDITEHAGKKVKIAFFHFTDNDSYASWGWYIDNVQVIKEIPDWDGDFECGWGDWSASNGVWEIGAPTAGPSSCYSGAQCAGTVLGGYYPTNTDSLLISPSFTVPIAGNIQLSFRHWYSYESGEYGKVQISVYDAGNGWSPWQDLPIPNITGVSGGWTKHPDIPLISYAGQKVRLGYAHITDNDSYASWGWYIDHIRITGFPHLCECDLNQDGKCNILDYQLFIQDWGRTNCGTPAGSGWLPNDCECDLTKDGKCNILDYQRFIEDWGNMACPLCP